MKRYVLAAIFAGVAGCTSGASIDDQGRTASVAYTGYVAVWIDPETGCHYVIASGLGGITPRMATYGVGGAPRQVCDK